jgi:hypothetical protein
MLTVREVADKYGVTTKFLTLALERIGYQAATPDTVLSAATVARFESAYGAKIRAARHAPAPGFTAESDAAPPPASRRQPKPHVMRVAHAKVTATRDPSGLKVKALLDHPGPVHAIDAAGTWDGDPWKGEVVPGAVHFYDGPINSGPIAACGYAKVRAVLGDEFMAADDPAAAGQCPKCAAAVAEGKGFRTPPHERRSYWCDEYLRLRVDGRVVVKDCCLRDFHGGRHRTLDGATWEHGVEDYVPAPTPCDD